MTVEPIRDRKKLDAMKKVLKAQSLRDWLLFVLGINSGLRISDLLQLKVRNVHNQVRIRILEGKTGKEKDFPLSETCIKAISRVQAYRIINAVAKMVGITVPIGTHTMRKTFGSKTFKNT